MWNGRFIAQSLVQLFMQFPKEVFNVANTIVFIAVGLLINLLVHRRIRDVNPIYLLATYCAMFYFLPDFGRACLMAFRKFQLSLDAIDLSWMFLVSALAVSSAEAYRHFYSFHYSAGFLDRRN